jgi:hypothetical protein
MVATLPCGQPVAGPCSAFDRPGAPLTAPTAALAGWRVALAGARGGLHNGLGPELV